MMGSGMLRPQNFRVQPRLGSVQDTPGYQLGNWLGKLPEKRRFLAPVDRYTEWLARNPGKGSVAGGLAGAGAGWLLSKIRGNDPTIPMLVGGGLGAGASYAGSRLFSHNLGIEKQSFYTHNDSDATTYIQARIANDYRLSHPQRQYLQGMLGQMSPAHRNALADTLKVAGGAGAGAIIAKFLLNLGFTGTILMSLAGAAVGSMFGGPERNAVGVANNNETDLFGRARLLQ